MRALRFAILIMTGVTLALAAGVEAQESLKVGVLTIRSGPATPVGDDILAGIQTATKMYGPVLGRPVELVVEGAMLVQHAIEDVSRDPPCGEAGHF